MTEPYFEIAQDGEPMTLAAGTKMVIGGVTITGPACFEPGSKITVGEETEDAGAIKIEA
jgi:hypothetical protein